jgi:hypothetical protein
MSQGTVSREGRTSDGALEKMLEEIRLEFPRFRIVKKSASPLSRLIDLALKAVTFGAQSQYMTHYHTVIADALYVPEGWEDSPPVHKIVMLRHERVHLRQRRRFGDILMTWLYLFPFFPLGVAYGRARIEWEAYTETIRATAELVGIEAAQSPALRRHIVRQFTSGAYGWMWPFPSIVNKWYDCALRAILAEVRTTPQQPQGLE